MAGTQGGAAHAHHALEEEQAALTARLEDPPLYGRPRQAQAVAAWLAVIETEPLELLKRWAALEARQGG